MQITAALVSQTLAAHHEIASRLADVMGIEHYYEGDVQWFVSDDGTFTVTKRNGVDDEDDYVRGIDPAFVLLDDPAERAAWIAANASGLASKL